MRLISEYASMPLDERWYQRQLAIVDVAEETLLGIERLEEIGVTPADERASRHAKLLLQAVLDRAQHAIALSVDTPDELCWPARW